MKGSTSCPWCRTRIEVDFEGGWDELEGDAWAAHDPQTCFLAWMNLMITDPETTRLPQDWQQVTDATTGGGAAGA